MGLTKKQLMENDQRLFIINDLMTLLSLRDDDDYYDPELISNLYDIMKLLQETVSNSNYHYSESLFSEDFMVNYSKLQLFLSQNDSQSDLNEKEKREYQELINILRYDILEAKNKLLAHLSNRQTIYNSEKYYQKHINELEKQKEELKLYLNEQKSIEGKTKEEIALQKKEIKEKELALVKAKEQINKYKTELEDKKKQENAVEEWNSKIKSTFSELTIYLKPIKDEHSRLNIMFWIYASLISLFIISVVLLEVNFFVKLNKVAEFPKWEDYLTSLIPIPVFGALLWAFIIQINRTQRQLVILAKHIHEIKYIEGLLLSINTLSPDISNSTKRVNIAIDRLLENHLNRNKSHIEINEENIKKEEKKDYIPYDVVIKLLKDTKEVIGK